MLNLSKNYIDYSIVALYMLAVVGIGVYFSRDKKNAETYLLSGRSLPAWVVGVACMMSMLSSISMVSVPGEIFNYGWTLGFLGSIFYPILSIPAYLLFAKFYFKLGSFTPYEYLEYRYDKGIRGIVAFSSFYLRVIYIGMVLYTSAKIFEGAFNWPAWFSIILTAVIGIASCFMGGSKAVVWTDVFQAFLTFGGLLTVIIIACSKIDGGVFTAVSTALNDGHGIPHFSQADFYKFHPYARLLFWMLLWNVVNNVLVDACSNQVTIQRILSCKNYWEGLKSQLYSNGLAICSSLLLLLIGLSLYSFYKFNPNPDIVQGKGDLALFYFIKHYVPQPFSGLFMAAMFAAIMSTISGVVNSMAGVWVKEFHIRFINKNVTPEKEYKLLRISTLIIGAIGISLALAIDFAGKWLSQTVSEVGTIFYLLGSAILPAYLFAVISKRANSKLIWATTLFAFGEGISSNVWYVLSRSSYQAWEADHSVGFGWAGPLEFKYIIPYIAIMVIFSLPYLIKATRKYLISKIMVLIGLMATGATSGMLVWYIFSNVMITDEPMARSFAFTFPVPFILSCIVLRFCPIQPEAKWRGLCLSDFNNSK